jgi:hypothetical protein
MCIACEMNFWAMIDALPPEDRERILREQTARFACEAGEGEPQAEPQAEPQPGADDPKPVVASRE